MRAIFASVDLSLWGGLLFRPVFGGDKPQMLVKRITSSVMSNDSHSGCVPSSGKSFSHWLLWRTLLRLRLNSVCLCWLSEVASSGKGWYVFRSFLNAAPPSLITRFRNFSPLLFSMELARQRVMLEDSLWLRTWKHWSFPFQGHRPWVVYFHWEYE